MSAWMGVRGLRSVVCGWAVLMLAVPALAKVSGPEMCGPVKEGMQAGPWDYRTEKQHLPLVENAHFTPKVEALIRGQTGTHVASDIHYTLGRYPNHHRALVAMQRLSEKDQRDARYKMVLPLECYYDRALRFKSDDVVVRMLYARFLWSQQRQPEALHQLSQADRLAEDSTFTRQNLGLVYLEMKEYDKALEQARIVARLDPAEHRLRDALVAAGRWKEPDKPGEGSAPEAAVSMPASSAASN